MSQLLHLCEKAVLLAQEKGADEAEAYGIDGKQTQVFLERNDVKLGKAQIRSGIGLRVFKSKGLGFASVNSLEPTKVKEMAERAVSLASRAPEDPHNRLPEPQPLRPVKGLYDEESEALTAEDILEYATGMLRAAKEYDPRVTVDSGTFDAAVGEKAIFSSRGVQASERNSTFTYFMMAFARDGQEVGSFDYLFEGTHKVADIGSEQMGRHLGERVVDALGARKAKTFKGTVLMNPYTVQPLVADLLASALNANNVQKGMSRLAGKVGQEIASSLLTVKDDGVVPGGLGSSSFDREGIPHTSMVLVEKGRLEGYLHNSYTAAKEGKGTTGHASGDQRNVPAIGPTNFIVDPGERSKQELIDEIDRGILVTRFSGWPQSVSGDFSGAVKGGFLIEKGDVAYPVKETLIAGNIFELLKNLSGISREVEEVFNYTLPYLRFEDVSITSG
ncbi:MAG: TldD/PmbA family protein [Thermoplasmata archaeon]